MKHNRLAKLLAVTAAGALVAGTAMAQTTTSVGAHVGPVGVGMTTSTGAFVAAPGDDYFTFRAGTAEPVRYYYTKDTTIVDPAGHTVAWTDVRPDMPATVEYVKEGDRMIVKKVMLTKPVVTEHESTTTTTTTHP
ncbi:MAG: hypothetical protein JO354_01900 [Verrucomicrobia bacterium]|nr:hypothetical protein [Verrucomicrobiota bacterium]